MITDSSWKYYSCIRIIFILCVIKELCYLISFHTLVSFKNCFLYLRGLLRTNNLRGITTKNVLLILHNCTRHVKKLWDKRNNDLTMIKTKLSPASQTSFLNLTIKSKRNIEPATAELKSTDELIINDCFYSYSTFVRLFIWIFNVFTLFSYQK